MELVVVCYTLRCVNSKCLAVETLCVFVDNVPQLGVVGGRVHITPGRISELFRDLHAFFAPPDVYGLSMNFRQVDCALHGCGSASDSHGKTNSNNNCACLDEGRCTSKVDLAVLVKSRHALDDPGNSNKIAQTCTEMKSDHTQALCLKRSRLLKDKQSNRK
eukprot:5167047-Amphidinium_carterae.1